MGKTVKDIRAIQTRRTVYQERKKKEVMNRLAGYMSAGDRDAFLAGEGFVELPEAERLRLRIDSYRYLR